MAGSERPLASNWQPKSETKPDSTSWQPRSEVNWTMDPAFQLRYAPGSEVKNAALQALPAAMAMGASAFIGPEAMAGEPLLARILVPPLARGALATAGGTLGSMAQQAETGPDYGFHPSQINPGQALQTGLWQGGLQTALDLPLTAAGNVLPQWANKMRQARAAAASARAQAAGAAAMPAEREISKAVPAEVQAGLAEAEARRQAAGQEIAQHLNAAAPTAEPITFQEIVDKTKDIMQRNKNLDYTPARAEALAQRVATEMADVANKHGGELIHLEVPRAPQQGIILGPNGQPIPAGLIPGNTRPTLPDWQFNLNEANLLKQAYHAADDARFEALRAGRSVPPFDVEQATSQAVRKLIEERAPGVAPLNTKYGAAMQVARRLQRMAQNPTLNPSDIEQSIRVARAQQMNAARTAESARIAGQQALSNEAPAGVSFHVGFPSGLTPSFTPGAAPYALSRMGGLALHPATGWSARALAAALASIISHQ